MPIHGIITDKKDGMMTIRIEKEATACEACAVRAFCKTGKCEENLMVLKDRPDLHTGDRVQVEEGRNILTKTALLAYGIPLVFFTAGILLGRLIPPVPLPPELLQFACGCAGLLAGGILGRALAKRMAQKIENYFIVKCE